MKLYHCFIAALMAALMPYAAGQGPGLNLSSPAFVGLIPRDLIGTPAPGMLVTSKSSGQWLLNGVAISGATGVTLETPYGVNVGDVISKSGANNTLTVPDPLAVLGVTLRLQTHKGDRVPLGMYQDAAATVPATAADHPIRVWRDEIGGTGVVATASSDAARPLLKFINGVPVVYFTGTSFLTLNKAATDFPASYSAVYNAYALTTGIIVTTVSGTNGRLFHMIYPNTAGRYRWSNLNSDHGFAEWGITSYVYSEATAATGTETIWFAGTQKNTRTGAVSNATSGALIMGSKQDSTFPFTGYISSLILAPVIWSDEQRITAENYAAYLMWAPERISLIGDSVTEGFVASDATFPTGNSYASLTMQAVGLSYIGQNFGKSGFTSPQMASTRVPAAISLGGRRRIVTVMSQTNELNTGFTAQQAADSAKGLCQTLKDRGFRVILMTVPEVAAAPNTPLRAASNAIIRADFPTVIGGIVRTGASYADRLVDLGSGGFVAGDYSDPLHPNDSGHAKIAAYLAPVITSLLP